jgi:hypothetical protein
MQIISLSNQELDPIKDQKSFPLIQFQIQKYFFQRNWAVFQSLVSAIECGCFFPGNASYFSGVSAHTPTMCPDTFSIVCLPLEVKFIFLTSLNSIQYFVCRGLSEIIFYYLTLKTL